MTEMTPTRFADLLDAYGAEPARWPAAERDAALTLLARDAAARRAQAQAASLDALLDRAPVAPQSAALQARVLAAAPTAADRQHSPVSPPMANRASPRSWLGAIGHLVARLTPAPGSWQPAAAMAAALVLGLIVGYTVPPTGSDGLVDSQNLDIIAFGTFADFDASLEAPQ